ncbi:MAG: hypothetical protein R3F13_16095 [Prosthecobacter sp.]
MNPETTASVICPSCGQAFLLMQRGQEGVAQCPHCAHTAPRIHFGTQAHVMGVAPGRRSVAQTPPVQEFSVPVFHPPETTQQVTHVNQAPTPAGVARSTLQYSQALMPTSEPPPLFDNPTPPQLRGSPLTTFAFMATFAGVCGIALWLWWDHANSTGDAPIKSQPPSLNEVQPAQPATQPAQVATFEEPDIAAFGADAKALVTELFAADTPERRAECIYEPEKYSEEIEAWANPAEKPELRLLAKIPGLPLALPGGRPIPLFKMVTSKCAAGALIRLEECPDGKRRLHWPTLIETHEAKLAEFLKTSRAEESGWFSVALRPSHGLDLPQTLRPKYLTFDAQIAAVNDPHLVACVERDSPLGRFMDRESEWGKVYISRLLVRRLDIEADAPCMIIMDCEGAAKE